MSTDQLEILRLHYEALVKLRASGVKYAHVAITQQLLELLRHVGCCLVSHGEVVGEMIEMERSGK